MWKSQRTKCFWGQTQTEARVTLYVHPMTHWPSYSFQIQNQVWVWNYIGNFSMDFYHISKVSILYKDARSKPRHLEMFFSTTVHKFKSLPVNFSKQVQNIFILLLFFSSERGKGYLIQTFSNNENINPIIPCPSRKMKKNIFLTDQN